MNPYMKQKILSLFIAFFSFSLTFGCWAAFRGGTFLEGVVLSAAFVIPVMLTIGLPISVLLDAMIYRLSGTHYYAKYILTILLHGAAGPLGLLLCTIIIFKFISPSDINLTMSMISSIAAIHMVLPMLIWQARIQQRSWAIAITSMLYVLFFAIGLWGFEK